MLLLSRSFRSTPEVAFLKRQLPAQDSLDWLPGNVLTPFHAGSAPQYHESGKQPLFYAASQQEIQAS